MADNVIVPVYSNGKELVELTADLFEKSGKEFIEAIQNFSSLKSNYTNHKNTYMILLLFFVIGNSAPYYYFENLRNKDAWPSHGLGGLFRKLIVHAIGFYFFMSLMKYIHVSSLLRHNNPDYSDLGKKYGCTIMQVPQKLFDLIKNYDSKKKHVLAVPFSYLTNVDDILNNMSSTVQDNLNVTYLSHLVIKKGCPSLNDNPTYVKDIITEACETDNLCKGGLLAGKFIVEETEYIVKSISNNWQLIIVVLFTVVFSNIITLKGYPIYGVTHMYNPFSCFRCTELIGYILGTPTIMKGFGKYINSLCGHTHYGVKSSMYDAYKMRNVPVYDMGWNTEEDMGLWGKVIAICNFGICIFLRYIQIVYIYTSASIFLNPLTALVLCIVGYVSATPMVFVGGSNAIKALNKKIDMFFLRKWLFYFTQGRCYKGNVFGGVVRRLCTLGFDTWVADAIFNNEQLALACENTFGAWWKRAWNTWKCAKEVNLKEGITNEELMFIFEGSLYNIKKSDVLNVYNKGTALEQIPYELVKIGTKVEKIIIHDKDPAEDQKRINSNNFPNNRHIYDNTGSNPTKHPKTFILFKNLGLIKSSLSIKDYYKISKKLLTIDTNLNSGVESVGQWTQGTKDFFKRIGKKFKLKKMQFGTELYDSEDYSSHSTTIKEKIIKWLKYSVQIFTGLGIGDNPWGFSLRSWTDKFNENTPFLKKIIGFALYYATTILQNLLGIGGYKEGKGTYFGNLLRISIMYFIATSIYSTKSGQLSFGNSLGFSGGMKFLNYALVGIVLLMLTLTSNTEYGIDLPNMSLILDPTLSFMKGIRGGDSGNSDTESTNATTSANTSVNPPKSIGVTNQGVGGGNQPATEEEPVTAEPPLTTQNLEYKVPCIDIKQTNEAFEEAKKTKNISKTIYDAGRTKFMSFYYDLLVSVKSGRFETIETKVDLELTKHFTELKGKLKEPNKNPYGGPFDDDSIYNLTNIYYKVVQILDGKTNTTITPPQKKMCQRFRYEFENLRIETGCYDQAASRTPTNKITRFMKNAPSEKLTDLLQKILKGAENLGADDINILMKFLKLMNKDVDKISSSNIKDFKLEELSEIFRKIGMTDFLTDLKKFMPIDVLVAQIEKLATSENEPEKKIYTKLQTAVEKYDESTPKSNSTAEVNATILDKNVITKSEQVATKSATKTSVMEQLRRELVNQKEYFKNNNSELSKILKALDELEQNKRKEQHQGVMGQLKAQSRQLKARSKIHANVKKRPNSLNRERLMKNLKSVPVETLKKKGMTGGAGTAPTKPKQQTPTLYNPLNCNDFDGSCCPQDATGFGTVMNEDVNINSLDGTNDPEKKNMNVFKSKICDVNYVKDNMDDGELYCLDGAYFNKDNMGDYITFQYASSSREKVTGATDPPAQPAAATDPPAQPAAATDPPAQPHPAAATSPPVQPTGIIQTGDEGDIRRISNTTPDDGVPVKDLSLDSFTKYVKPSEPIMKKVKSSNAYLWNTSFVPSIFNGGAGFWGRFNSNTNYIPPSVCSNLLISNMLMSLDATLYDNQKLSSFGRDIENKESTSNESKGVISRSNSLRRDVIDNNAALSDASKITNTPANNLDNPTNDPTKIKAKESGNNNKIGSIYNLLEHPMRKYYPMVDINPFDINVQLYGQKFSDWTQFFIGSDKNEDKSIYITSTNEGGVITLRDSYLYTLMSDKETDANAESCHKFYCNKPRCFEITKQCSKYPSVLPNKVFVDHKYMKSTCQCSELDGLMPVQQKTDDGKDPKYWMVHFMENKQVDPKNKSGPCKDRSKAETEILTGINEENADLTNMNEQLLSVYTKYESKIDSLEGQMKEIYKLSEKEDPTKTEIPNYKYFDYRKYIKDEYSKEKFKKILDKWHNLKSKKFNPFNSSDIVYPAPIAEKLHNTGQNVPAAARTSDKRFDPATGRLLSNQTAGSQFTQELSDLFGKWSTNLRNKQNTGHTYYVPIEYMDTTTGKKFEIEDILVDPVHSRIKVEGIGKSIAFTEEKLKEVVEMYMHEMRGEERRKNSLNEEEKMKHTLSFSDYMTYKKTNDTSNFDDHDEVVGTYDTLDEANTIMKNQSGGGKYVNIDGEKVILKIGKNEKYITKTGRLVSVQDYKNKNNYVELMTIDGEPMKIMSKNKEYYLQKDGTLIKCNN